MKDSITPQLQFAPLKGKKVTACFDRNLHNVFSQITGIGENRVKWVDMASPALGEENLRAKIFDGWFRG